MYSSKNNYLAYVMCVFPLLFFAYQFILRLWPGLMMQQIMQQFSIDASSFGILAAFYYYGYAGMQIPVAIMLDRFGARWTIFIFATICGLATIMFLYTSNFYLAVLSRFLIGAGSAVGFLGTSKVISAWFAKSQYARMIGLSFTVGLLGAIYGGRPVNLLIEEYSWQKVALILAMVSISIGFGAYLVVRTPRQQKPMAEQHGGEQEKFTLIGFSKLLASKKIWLLAIANLLMVGSLEGFADVWGVKYLMTAHHLTKNDAASLTSFIFFGMLFGGPLLAAISKRIGSCTVIIICGLGMALLFTFLLLNYNYNWWVLATMFFAIGILCCYQVIVFATGTELVAAKYLGVTVAFLNCINMLGGSFFHTVIGKIMDLFWTGSVMADGLRQYELGVYTKALSIIPVSAMLGAIIVWVLGMLIKQHKRKYPLVMPIVG